VKIKITEDPNATDSSHEELVQACNEMSVDDLLNLKSAVDIVVEQKTTASAGHQGA
jgi:hypothetical protein